MIEMSEPNRLTILLIAVLALALAAGLERREAPEERLHLAVQGILIVVLLFMLVVVAVWENGCG